MALDLSALEEKPPAAAASVVVESTGKPLDIPVADIEEDPDQPRKEFSEEAMQEMTASIRLRGVKTPVSVRKHPSRPGKWMLNYGARRFRGTLAAERPTIPAFIDESHDHYDQVIENLQRDDLKPMELALFIKKRLDAGDQKKAIATNLGKDGAIITQHLALIDPPACVEHAYSSGKCTSPKTLYELRGLHEKFPEQVEAWCASTNEITRKTVTELAEVLKGKSKTGPKKDNRVQLNDSAIINTTADEKFGHDQILTNKKDAQPSEDVSAENRKATSPTDFKKGNEDDEIAGEGGNDAGKLTSWPKGRAVSDPERMNKPLMLIEFDGRAAAVLLNRRPSTPGLIHIRFEDGSGDQEVNASACKINLLTEVKK